MANPLYNRLNVANGTGTMGTGSMGTGPMGFAQSVMARAKQIAGAMQSPEQLVRQYLPDAPAEMIGNPEGLIDWMQKTGRVNPQTVQMARQLMGK